ncbi:MAG: GcrA family cell cycle regulator, partial [Alphaproteobacteria bacterium]|nr:GcrA family cell cycle regulator [Alphaproteobacteria bacterium]
AEALDCTKNMVIAKARRAGLPSRVLPSAPRWSHERTDAFRKAWAQGLSAHVIAREFGFQSLDSVRNKASKMGLARRLLPTSPATAAVVADLPVRPASVKSEPLPAPLPEPPPEPVTAGPASAHGCQWITSNGRPWTFCAAPVKRPGSAWCAEHHRSVYVRASHHQQGRIVHG